MNKDTLTRLFQMLNINENKDNNTINKIRSNYATYSKLELIAKQVNLLKNEAQTIIDNHNMNLNLGFYPYPDYEPMEFWGDICKLQKIIKGN